MRHRRSNEDRRGYTLIELIMVIALLGLASSLVIPQMTGLGTLETQAAVRQLIADLSYAQSTAMANQEFRRVHFYDDGRGYCLIRVNEATFGDDFDPDTADYLDNDAESSGNLGLYIVDYLNDPRWKTISIELVDIDDGNNEISYDALGGTVASPGVPGTGGTIRITGDGETYELTVAPFTGKLTVARIP